jgi:murein L,D-transpeptidase YcbB/YkuD
LAIATVGLAAALAWQLSSQSEGDPPTERLGPAPATTTATATGGPHGSDGLASAAAGRAASQRSAAPQRPDRPPATAPTGAPRSAPELAPVVVASTGPATTTPSNESPTAAPVVTSPVATATTTTPPASAPAPRTLSAGDTGPDVTQLQLLLYSQGFTYVSQTGVYDKATVRGVTKAQKDRGLTCDPPGVYGPCTRAALSSS